MPVLGGLAYLPGILLTLVMWFFLWLCFGLGLMTHPSTVAMKWCYPGYVEPGVESDLRGTWAMFSGLFYLFLTIYLTSAL